MFLRCLLELQAAVLFRPFGKKIDDMASDIFNPLYGASVVKESKYFNGVKIAGALRPGTYFFHCFTFTVRHSRRGYLYARNVKVEQKQPSDGQFLGGGE